MRRKLNEAMENVKNDSDELLAEFKAAATESAARRTEEMQE